MSGLAHLLVDHVRFPGSSVKEVGLRTSLEALLATVDAAELVFSCFFDNDTSYTVMWLPGGLCLISMGRRALDPQSLLPSFHEDDDGFQYFQEIEDQRDENDSNIAHDGELELEFLFPIDITDHHDRNISINVYMARTAGAIESAPAVVAAAAASMDALFELLARHKSLASIFFQNVLDPPMALFPVSTRALTTFVSQTQSPRVIGFGDLDVYSYDAFNMSSDQWQALLCHCNGNVKLRVDIGNALAEDVLIDALNHHQCPAKLFLFHVDYAFSVARVEALAQNTSVVELQLDFSGPISTHEHRHLILGTGIANNRGLRKLNLLLFHMDDEDWECLWDVVASHPTIESLILDDVCSFHPLSAAKSTEKQRADVMLQALRCNTCVLRELECNYQTLFQLHDHDNDNDDLGQQRALSKLVRAALELNRWRPRLLAIRQETSAARRERWFVESLLVVVVVVAHGDQQQELSRENLSFLFLLLNENPELLERSIRAKRRQSAMADVSAEDS
jgi:hypothetical protein